MKICYYADGRYVHALRWMKFFADRGHEMHLISFAEVSIERARELEKQGIRYHGHTGNFHLRKPWLTYGDLRFVKSVLRRQKIDVLHSHFLAQNIWYGYLSRFHPHLITIMGGDVIGENWKPDANVQERLLTERALKSADGITAWSAVLAKRVKPFLDPRIEPEVVHGGVDLKIFSPGVTFDDLRRKHQIPPHAKIVFSSRIVRRLYNIDKIAKAANIVCSKMPGAYFAVALPSQILDSEYVSEVKRIFAEGPAKTNVRYIPSINHNEIADYYRFADLTISIPNTDGTPMTVLESMACGTPTIIGNLPDYDREYFENGKTTLMVDVNDPESIARGILSTLDNDDMAAGLVDEALRRVVATGGYEFQMKKMENIYHGLLAAKRSQARVS